MSSSLHAKAAVDTGTVAGANDPTVHGKRKSASHRRGSPAPAAAHNGADGAVRELQAEQIEKYKSAHQYMLSHGTDKRVAAPIPSEAVRDVAPEDARLLRQALGNGKRGSAAPTRS